MKNNKSNNIAGVIICLIFVGIISYGIYWYINSSGYIFSTNKETDTDIVINNQYANNDIEYIVEAIGTNNGDKAIEHISVEFSCYDENGSVVGTADDYLSSKVGSKSTWNIHAVLFTNDASIIKECVLEEITALNAN